MVEVLQTAGAIDEGGKVQPAVKPEEIVLPQELKEVRETVLAVVEKAEPVAAETLTGAVYTQTVVEEKQVTYDDARELLEHFQKKDYISRNGKMKDTMKNALKASTLELPKKYEAARSRLESVIASADRKPIVRDASRDVVVRLNKQVMLSPEFMELWGKIKQKTTYRVSIDTERLVENCVKALREMPRIVKTRLVYPVVPGGMDEHPHHVVPAAQHVVRRPAHNDTGTLVGDHVDSLVLGRNGLLDHAGAQIQIPHHRVFVGVDTRDELLGQPTLLGG